MVAPSNPPIPTFHAGTVEDVCKVVAGLYTGTELTGILVEVPLKNDPGEGHTKWRRLEHVVSRNQATTRNGNALVGLINVAMRPDRTLGRKARADEARDELNRILSLAGCKVRDDGKVARASKATTDTQAQVRTTRMRKLLE